MHSRSRMRSSEFETIHGFTAVNDTASTFFPFFTKLWPWIQVISIGILWRKLVSFYKLQLNIIGQHWLIAVNLQHLQLCYESDESACEENTSGGKSSVLSNHSKWLPVLSKWGGVANSVVRSHWIGSVVPVLYSIQGQGGSLTSREQKVFESLLSRRDFWTDDQVIIWCLKFGFRPDFTRICTIGSGLYTLWMP
jgi:hypothetical protein